MSRLQFATAVTLVLLIGCSSPAVSITPTITRAPGQPTLAPTVSIGPTTSSAPASPTSSEPGNGSFISPFATGFTPLTFVTNAGDGSGDLYVVEQAGQIIRLQPGQSAPGSAWLDISARISSGGERGLLGLAFHPQFAT